MSRGIGERENLRFTLIDYWNYALIAKVNQAKLDDTDGILDYLHRMQLEDPHFFYALKLYEEGLICNIFWTNVNMRFFHSWFNDVVSFDTMYRRKSRKLTFCYVH